MSNMSYCRFENTYNDLGDCANHIDDMDLSKTEARYRKRLVEQCQQIIRDAENCGLIEDGEVVENWGTDDGD